MGQSATAYSAALNSIFDDDFDVSLKPQTLLTCLNIQTAPISVRLLSVRSWELCTVKLAEIFSCSIFLRKTVESYSWRISSSPTDPVSLAGLGTYPGVGVVGRHLAVGEDDLEISMSCEL